MRKKDNFYITTAIAYANDKPHIGFLFEMIAADILARAARQVGFETFFLTGTDEHGAKIARKAQEAGVDPQRYVDLVSDSFRSLGRDFEIDFDYFIRTTDERHKKFVQDSWTKLVSAGYLEKRRYSGLYCFGCEAFLTDRDLKDGRCPIHQGELEEISEENWFFLLSKFQRPIEDWLKTDPIYPGSKLNEIREFVAAGLADISFSRHRQKLNWGVPVPDDPDQVIYVWVDALLNYLSALEICDRRDLWPASIQIIGKDITRFHGVTWPALLLALGQELPKKLLVHGFIQADGQKMSKSFGNLVTPEQLRARYGRDGARYLLFRLFNFYQDSNFVWDEADRLYHGELSNGIGNLVARSLSLISGFQEEIGSKKVESVLKDERTRQELEARELIQSILLQRNDFSGYLETINRSVNRSDGYITSARPWEWRKTGQVNEDNLRQFVASVPLFYLSSLIAPLLPATAAAIDNGLKTFRSAPLFPRLS